MQKSEPPNAGAPLGPPKATSPANRRAAREQAEADALAALKAEAEARRARSAKLRELRLSKARKK